MTQATLHIRRILAGAFFMLLWASGRSAAPSGAQGRPVALAAERYKNIQVLKTLPADQLLPTMQSFSRSLRVACNFCHVVKPDNTGYELDSLGESRMLAV